MANNGSASHLRGNMAYGLKNKKIELLSIQTRKDGPYKQRSHKNPTRFRFSNPK